MSRTVVIVGGGLAGITAALRLSASHGPVTIVDSSPRIGGRPVAVSSDIPLVLFGCHTATWSLIESLGTAEAARCRSFCPLEFFLPQGERVRLAPGRLPSPAHAVKTLLGFRGLSWKDRWRLLNFLERIWEGATPMPSDLESRTAAEWLSDIGQSSTACRNVWTPLSRFLLGDNLERVSADMWSETLRRHYLARSAHATLSVPSSTLRELVLDRASRQMTRAGVRFRLGTTASQLQFHRDRVAGLQLQDGSILTADWYVVAVPHDRLQSLLPERIATHYATFGQLSHLRSVPGLVVHLHIRASVRASRVILLADGTFHWIVVRPASHGEEASVSLWCVGEPDRLSCSDEQLLQQAHTDLSAVDAALGQATVKEQTVIRYPQAFLSLEPGSRPYRPLQQTPFSNLFLAGDWTETGWPSCVEGAVLSGNRCAELIAASAMSDGAAFATTQTGSTCD